MIPIRGAWVGYRRMGYRHATDAALLLPYGTVDVRWGVVFGEAWVTDALATDAALLRPYGTMDGQCNIPQRHDDTI